MNSSRLHTVIENMAKENLSQILVTGTAALYYLTGLWVEPNERMIALYINADGQAVLFGNELFAIREPGVEYHVHTDVDDPIQELSTFVQPGALGIDKDWPSRFLISLMGKRPDIRPVYGSVPVDMARLYKDAEEIQAMIDASKKNDEVVQIAIESLYEGITESEAMAAVNKAYRDRGADRDGQLIIGFGANAADPHYATGSAKLKKGDSVVLDLFTPIHRYWCDMTRTVFFGEPEEEAKRVYEIVKQANEAAEAAVRPGVTLAELDGIARGVIEKAGYGPYFTHRLGHGIGLECHEPPDVSSKSTEIAAEPGMCFSIEPGVYLPGRFGVRIEDLVLVTEDGCVVLNQAPKEMRIIK